MKTRRLYLFSLFLCLVAPLFAASDGQPELRVSAEIKKSAVVGEALVYEVRLLSSTPQVSDVRVVQAPSFPDGVKVIRGTVGGNRPSRVKEKGKEWYSWVIARDYVIPESAGKFSVGEGRYVVFLPVDRIVDHGFWGRRRVVEYEEVPVASKSVAFKVSALPSAKGSSLEFAGCVGSFKVEGWFPPGRIVPGSEAYAVFTISGYGSLADLRLPNLYRIFGSGCSLREVEQDERVLQRDGRLFSEVTLTCRFLPEAEEFTVEPLRLRFFNPESGTYYEAASDPLQWTGHPSVKKTDTPKDAIEI